MAKDIKVALTLDSSQFDSSLDKSRRKVKGFETGGVASFGRVAGAIAGVVASAKGLSTVISTGANFQDLQDSLNIVFGSAEKGSQAFKRIKDFSLQTQFGVDTLTNAFIQLKGAGVEPTEELLMTFADTASVTTDQMGTFQAALDLVSRSTAGGLGLEDLNRLADRGIPVFQILSEKLNLSRLEVSEFGKSASGADKIIKALTEGLNERFGGALQQKLDNVNVKFSNMKIAFENLAVALFDKIEPVLVRVLDNMTKFAVETEKVVAGFDSLEETVQGVQKAFEPVIDFFERFSAVITALVAPAILRAFVLLTTRLVEMGVAAAKGLRVVAGIVLSFKSLAVIGATALALIVLKIGELIFELTQVEATVTEKLVVGFKIFANTVVGILAGVSKVLIASLVNPINEFIEFVKDPLNYDLPGFTDIGTAIGEAFNEGFVNGAKLFEIPEKFQEVQKEFQDLDLSFLDGLFEEGGITDIGFIMEDQANKVSGAVDKINSKTNEMADNFAAIGDQLEQGFLEVLGRAQKSLSEDLSTALLEGQSALGSFKDFFKTIVKQMIAEAIRLLIIQPILQGIFSAFGAPIKFSAGGVPSFKAMGGAVSAGDPYIVGEKGPELFVPQGSGTIMPNGSFGGQQQVVYNINAVDTQSFQQALARDPEFLFSVTQKGARSLPSRSS